MKKIYLFILALILGLPLYAQTSYTYQPFPLNYAAVWTQRTGNGDNAPTYACFGIGGTGDTIINGQSYSRLYKSPDLTFTDNEYFAGIREAGKRIYLNTAGVEKVLYDFNLTVGDTFPANNIGTYARVNIVDTIEISPGVFRRRLRFVLEDGSNMPWSGSWIEGIGNGGIGGLVNTFALQPTCDCATHLMCAGIDQNWIYHNPDFSTTNCVQEGTWIDDLPATAKAGVLVAPNPVTGVSRLVIDSKVKVDRIDIFDGRGLPLQSFVKPGKGSIQIDRNTYAPGMYFYKVTISGQAAGSGKFSVL